MGAASARSPIASRGRLNELLAWHLALQRREDAPIRGDDELGVWKRFRSLKDPVWNPPHRPGPLPLPGFPDAPAPPRREKPDGDPRGPAFEFFVDDAGTVPENHVRPGLLLDVAAKVLIRRPEDLFPFAFKCSTTATAMLEVTTQSARAFTAAEVLAYTTTVRSVMGIAKGVEGLRRAAQVQSTRLLGWASARAFPATGSWPSPP